MASKKLIKTREALEIVPVTGTTLRRLTQKGVIKGFKVGGTYLYYEADLRAAMKQEPSTHPAN